MEYYFSSGILESMPDETPIPDENSIEDLNDDDVFNDVPLSDNSIDTMREATTSVQPVLFRYNPLHDLDIDGNPVSRNSDEKRDHAQQYSYAKKLFYTQTKRVKTMFTGATFVGQVQHLHNSVQPAGEHLENLRSNLAARYRKAEETPADIDNKVAKGLYDQFIQTFIAILRKLRRDVMIGDLECKPPSDVRTNISKAPTMPGVSGGRVRQSVATNSLEVVTRRSRSIPANSNAKPKMAGSRTSVDTQPKITIATAPKASSTLSRTVKGKTAVRGNSGTIAQKSSKSTAVDISAKQESNPPRATSTKMVKVSKVNTVQQPVATTQGGPVTRAMSRKASEKDTNWEMDPATNAVLATSTVTTSRKRALTSKAVLKPMPSKPVVASRVTRSKTK
ncbi:hypothetical protein IEO21_08325 [Rhodonia placenta]|uniref:Uncharacterized protein n=1 Tax=Rhodonia placenta TaxID=104341 RepID=A0A8H7TZC5_9APHY|nr:hypothetical protein IEO21_08325 [Postia placenta]